MLICRRGVRESCGRVRSAMRCVRRQVEVTTNYQEFLQQRGAIITALLHTEDAAIIID